MKSVPAMRPQDIVVLLKVIALGDKPWQYRDLASSLSISISEISDSLVRNHIAGLIDEGRRNVHRQSFMEFLQYGIRHVFPTVPGSIVTGLPTAHSYKLYSKQFSSDINYVWPHDDGEMRGLAIHPLHKGVPEACLKDPLLYELLASVDVLRVGRPRERQVALKKMQKEIL